MSGSVASVFLVKRFIAALSLPFSLALLACSVPVATGLDEVEANRVIVALDQVFIDATKESDPDGEGRFRVSVPRDDVARALAALADEELPRPRTQGVLEAMNKGLLITSRAVEHAELVAGMAGDLERTLGGVDGVVRARVHLSVPVEERGFSREREHPERATASVLLEYRGERPPLDTPAVQQIVSGGVGGLLPADVSVVTVARVHPPARGDLALAHVGPVAVARGSMRTLTLLLVTLAGVIALLAAVTVFLMSRIRKLRALLARPAKSG